MYHWDAEFVIFRPSSQSILLLLVFYSFPVGSGTDCKRHIPAKPVVEQRRTRYDSAELERIIWKVGEKQQIRYRLTLYGHSPLTTGLLAKVSFSF